MQELDGDTCADQAYFTSAGKETGAGGPGGRNKDKGSEVTSGAPLQAPFPVSLPRRRIGRRDSRVASTNSTPSLAVCPLECLLFAHTPPQRRIGRCYPWGRVYQFYADLDLKPLSDLKP